MAKTKRLGSGIKSGKPAAKVLGVTKDGVRILKPKGKATHFTTSEIRSALSSVRAAKKAG
jgi:hypothetical protein